MEHKKISDGKRTAQLSLVSLVGWFAIIGLVLDILWMLGIL